jgi:hypothetical protein
MNRLLAIGLACAIPTSLAAEDPASAWYLMATESSVVIDEPSATADQVACARPDAEGAAADCMVLQRAVLGAHVARAPIRDRARRL